MADEEPQKKDLRFTEHEEKSVNVDRDLSGSGRLARGDKTNMSILNFSSRHQARTERDPDFEFRPAPEPRPSPGAPEAPPAPVVAQAGKPDSPSDPSVLDRIKKLLGM